MASGNGAQSRMFRRAQKVLDSILGSSTDIIDAYREMRGFFSRFPL
jgi:hypothetical protein